MLDRKVLGVDEKARMINNEPSFYGTFAEIGAGQEVARQFFRVGGASQTVAKTMSAYDMIISDTIYGKEDSGRYVVQSRVRKMVDREFELLVERLKGKRDTETSFFSYANTVATSWEGSGRHGHGWMAVKFQNHPTAKPSTAVIHVVLKDKNTLAQQFCVGILGTNLLHACYYSRESSEEFIASLKDNLANDRIEIDMICCEGEAFKHLDNRLLSLELVKLGLTQTVFFDSNGDVFEPAEKLYKKNMLILRGSFRPPTHVTLDMLKCGKEEYAKMVGISEDEVSAIAEITMNNLSDWGDIDGKDFLARVDLLGPLGLKVMISNQDRHYKLSSFLKKFSDKPAGMVLGFYNLKEMLEEKHYQDLEGGILQSFGVLINNRDKIIVYPYMGEDKKLVTSADLVVDEKYKFFFQHLRDSQLIVDIKNPNRDILHIYSRKVLNMIKEGDKNWETMVPENVVKLIKESCLFGTCET